MVKGAVNPFSIVNDTEGSVKLCLEKALVESKEAVCFHPMDNSKTVVTTPEQLLAFLKHNGRDFDVVDLTVDPNAPAAAPKPKAAKPAKPAKAPKKEDEKGVNKEGMQDTKEGDFAKWYQQVITKAELIEYYDIKGCYILRPAAMGIWKKIVDYMDAFITDDLEVDPCYFPMFVSKHALEKEEGHIDGFAAEVAWVTKSGSSDLEEPIAVRPTSETVMYPAFAKWIRSWRDLPLKLNQWCNVVRWEFSHATPFIRTREFLWQEGHTAHATQAEADKEVREVLDLYARVYEDLLAVPVAKGKKTEKEKFAGGHYTTTVEAFVPTVGRSVQGATSHCLGDNFGKMFNITYEDENKKQQIPIQNSWGMTTRTIGVMIMVHGDNKGLVLPPRVATTQVVFVPVGINNKTKHRQDEILNKCTELAKALKKAGIRAKADIRDTVTSGNKCNHWELRGVPIRLEVGPNELDKSVVHACFRFNGEKRDLPLEDLAGNVQSQLDRVHNTMLANARKVRDERTELMRAGEWDKFVPFLNQLKVAVVPFCGGVKCEEEIKKVSADTAQELKESAGEGEEVCLSQTLHPHCTPQPHRSTSAPRRWAPSLSASPSTSRPRRWAPSASTRTARPPRLRMSFGAIRDIATATSNFFAVTPHPNTVGRCSVAATRIRLPRLKRNCLVTPPPPTPPLLPHLCFADVAGNIGKEAPREWVTLCPSLTSTAVRAA